MAIVKTLICEYEKSKSQAIELAKKGKVQEAFNKYCSSIATLIVIDTVYGLALEDSHKYKETAANYDSLFLETCYEAIEYAIDNDLNFEAMSIIDMLKSRRLQKEIGSLIMKGVIGEEESHSFVTTDLGSDIIDAIFSVERKSTAIQYFYFSPLKHELHAFIIYGSSAKWSCDRKLLFDSSQSVHFTSTINKYIRSRNDKNRNNELSNQLLEEVLDLLGNRLESHTTRLTEMKIKKLIISPHSILHQIPVHAALFNCKQRKGHFASPFDSIVFIPSIRLYSMITFGQDTRSWEWDVIGNFDISRLDFSPATLVIFQNILRDHKKQVFIDPVCKDIENIKEKTLIYFDCHGSSNEQDFMNSKILFKNGSVNFRDILNSYTFKKTWLVFLNACETGLNFNPEVLLDEYYGLDGAFLAKGALNTISTFSTVSDIAAFLIAVKTLLNILYNDMGVSKALLEAQIWLRDGGWKDDNEIELILSLLNNQRINENEYLLKKINSCKSHLASFLNEAASDYFSKPIHWAQWKCSGFGENTILY